MRNRARKQMDLNTAMNAYIEVWKRKEQQGPVLDLSEGAFERFIGIYSEPRYVRGRNFYAAKAENVKTDVEFKIHARGDISEDMRVVFKGVHYHIEAILPIDSEERYSLVRCYEIKHDDV